MDMRAVHLCTDFRHTPQLSRRNESARTADAQHIVTILSLFVDTHWHTVRLQLSAAYFTLLKLLYEPLIVLNVCCQTLWNDIHNYLFDFLAAKVAIPADTHNPIRRVFCMANLCDVYTHLWLYTKRGRIIVIHPPNGYLYILMIDGC